MFPLRSIVFPTLLVTFDIMGKFHEISNFLENLQKFPVNTKFPEKIYNTRLLLLLLLLLKTSRLSWRKPKLQGHGTTVTKRLERVDVNDFKTAEKGESSDNIIVL